ncbi:MAG TPA: methylmalonyl-CoA mutase family protein [Bacteroidales bacterium]|nr:methylmalonyl-CoA mutase family protein [Bacteroidales bacterium]
MDEQQQLFSSFPPVTVAEWEAKIHEDLKGADYAKKLIRKTPENISIKPYYTREDLEKLKYLDHAPATFPFARGNRTCCNSWLIRQDFKVTETEAAVEKAFTAASRGAGSIGFDLKRKGGIHYDEFRKLVTGLDSSAVQLNFITGNDAPQILDFLFKALDESGNKREAFKGAVEFDPLGHLAATGGFYYSEQDDMEAARKMMDIVLREAPSLRTLAANSHLFSDAGATVVQELAFGLSMISDYLVNLADEQRPATEVLRHMQWNLGTGSDYFMEIAKVRAARVLVSNLVSAFNPTTRITPVFIHSITTTWNKTLYDPHVNLLRLTTEAMSAVLGGCNSLLVMPFDTVYNEPTDLSERLARNIQIILREESYFNKVVDPAAGSYYIESLTDSLIHYAWELFIKIDEQGGFTKSFLSGFINGELEKTARQRLDLIASRRESLLGTNQYPAVNESVNGCINEEIAFPAANLNSEKLTEPVMPRRAAAEFEKLRLSVEKYPGHRPRVFMLTYGNLAMRLARSQFSANFFACAGYEVIDNLGFKNEKEGVDAAFAAKADIIVVCSSDDEYTGFAPEVAQLVGDRAIVVVAGAPASMEELKQKGITEFIHMRSNVLETLRHFHSKLGIQIKQ